MYTATRTERNLHKTAQRHYKLDPPYRFYEWNTGVDNYTPTNVEYVVVSRTSDETFIFPADSRGKITDWLELEGSITGQASHEEALEEMGYVV